MNLNNNVVYNQVLTCGRNEASINVIRGLIRVEPINVGRAELENNDALI